MTGTMLNVKIDRYAQLTDVNESDPALETHLWTWECQRVGARRTSWAAMDATRRRRRLAGPLALIP